jgi:hypothetical protein
MLNKLSMISLGISLGTSLGLLCVSTACIINATDDDDGVGDTGGDTTSAGDTTAATTVGSTAADTTAADTTAADTTAADTTATEESGSTAADATGADTGTGDTTGGGAILFSEDCARAGCGWGAVDKQPNVDDGYICGGEAEEDPDGVFPRACPEGTDLVDGGVCGDIEGPGCCDGDTLWFCATP